MAELDLTEAEIAAKNQMIRLVIEASKKPCDLSGANMEAKLPHWYDEAKFKRGQKYFFENRFGMMVSNLTGLITLLFEPKGLKILSHTEKSSTPETAKKRYVETILHMISWYSIDLSPNSKSWASLNKVRKMHFFASNSANKKNLGFISQTEISLTTFGFMGYALVRPHVLGIGHDNDEDREAFVFFWAVIGYMLGVEDQYNICLNKLEVVEMICNICIRYIYIPLLQFETPLFKDMVKALIDGLDEFTPFSSYETQLFLARRIAGVPGYQLEVDLEKETICRKIFTSEELNNLKNSLAEHVGYEYLKSAVFDEDIHLYNVQKIPDCFEATEDNIERNLVTGTYKKLDDNTDNMEDRSKALTKLLELKHDEELVITKIKNIEDWKNYLNDSKIQLLSSKDQGLVRFNCRTLKYNNYAFGRLISESILSVMLYKIRRASGNFEYK